MGLIVNTNSEAINAQRNLGINNSKLAISIKRLSSGLRINSAADDAAGLSIATKFAAQVRGIGQAIRNGNNAISLVQVAEGAINASTNILQRLRELSVQAASDDNTASDRAILGKEVENLTDELTRIGLTTEFNTQKLLDGSFNNKIFQVGANSGQEITLNIGNLSSSGIGGRAEFTASIANGVTNAIDENFDAGEMKINDIDIAATNEADDQFSVLEIQSEQMDAGTSAISGLTININGTAVAITYTGGADGASGLAGSTLATDVVSAINAAGITNVTARVVNESGFTITGAGGTNLFMAAELDVATTATTSGLEAINSELGLDNVSAMLGSGGAGQQVQNYNGESSAIAKAVAINRISSSNSVNATDIANVITSDVAISAVTLSSGDLYLNGINIGGVTVTAADATGSLLTAINNRSVDTGITASTDSAGKLVLTAKDGRNISLTFSSDSSADNIGFDESVNTAAGTNESFVFRSKVRINSTDSFDVTAGSSATIEDLDSSSGASITVSKDIVAFNIAKIRIDTQANAASSLLTIDAALNDVNKLRADLGAVQNRIEFSIANLEVARENSSASESRIRDVDFASEVAIFTKNQILVQAGASMLAQANTLPQIALQLLQ